MNPLDNVTPSILIVDDEPRNVQLIGSMLEPRRYRVEFALSAEEALDWSAAEPFDLFLLDVMLPGMDGFELCGRLRAAPHGAEAAVIFITARSDVESVVRGLDLGANDFVTKPFRSAELLARVDTQLRLKATTDYLKRLAIVDGLTGLSNHSHICTRLTQAISVAERHGRPLAVLMLDLDRFKRINDTHGHPVGDRVLADTAAAVQQALRAGDDAGRYGGEEFLLIFPDTTLEAAHAVAERIRRSVLALSWEIDDVHVSVSGGVCAWQGQSADELIARADRLLYEAKTSGRDRIVGFDG